MAVALLDASAPPRGHAFEHSRWLLMLATLWTFWGFLREIFNRLRREYTRRGKFKLSETWTCGDTCPVKGPTRRRGDYGLRLSWGG